MPREKYQNLIEQRIAGMKDGTVFIPSDFADIANAAAVLMALSRLESMHTIRRIMRGVYDKPRYSQLLNEFVSPHPAEVANAIARKYHWTITPTEDTALNLLHLSTQVPVVWKYVSDGPYKEYSYDRIRISFRHSSNKETSGYSPMTALVIQALRAIGKERVDEAVIRILRRQFTEEEKRKMLLEAKSTTAWIYSIMKEISKENAE